MNTTSKGDAFEDRVYSTLKEELDSESLGVSPRLCKMHRKKAYPSRDRGSAIVVDISIEQFMESAEEYSILWVIECKDYSGAIPVNDLEEFDAKIRQIGEHNTKGVFVTSGALQCAALNYARSKKIGVVRLLPDNQITFICRMLTVADMQRASRLDPSEFQSALTNPAHQSMGREFYGLAGNYLAADWSLVFACLTRES